VQDIILSINDQMEGHTVKYLLLVGGFGDSPYLRGEVRRNFCERSEIIIANGSTGKAVADGAVAWYIRRSVTGRATRFAYGVEVLHPYEPSDFRHGRRKVRRNFDGDYVEGIWNEIVAKDHTFEYSESRRRSYYRSYSTAKPSLGSFNINLYAHTGSGDAPYFVLDNAGDVRIHEGLRDCGRFVKHVRSIAKTQRP